MEHREQAQRYERFRALHVPGRPLLMPNAWDGTSAALLRQAGFQALGSSSGAIAQALGRRDGVNAVSRSDAIANARLLAEASGLPVNGDLEAGFGPEPEDCAETVRAAVAAGLAGLGIEDTTGNLFSPIHDFDAAVKRLKRAAGEARGRILLTGRTDVLLHGTGNLEEVLRRLVAFADIGADVLFAPGLSELEEVRRVVEAVRPKPVNILVTPALASCSLDDLSGAGVARISVGSGLYRIAMATALNAARAMAEGDFRSLHLSVSPVTSDALMSDT